MKMRSDCLLQNLSAQQLDEVFDLLSTGSSFREVRLHCAKPPPEGFGLAIHHTTLVRFYQAERRRRHAEQLAQSKFDDMAAANADELVQNIKIELAHACYDLAYHPGAPTTVSTAPQSGICKLGSPSSGLASSPIFASWRPRPAA